MKTLNKLFVIFLISTVFTGCIPLQVILEGECPSLYRVYSNNTESETPGIDSALIKSNQKKTSLNDDNQIFLSFGAGAKINFPITEKLSFDTGLIANIKGNKTATGSGASKFESKLNLVYIDFPLVAKYQLGQGGFNVYGGVQPAILISAKNKTTFNGASDTQKVNDQYKTLDVGATVGGGYAFNNGIGINLGYVHGLTNILKDEAGGGSLKTKNRMLTLGASYTFNNN